MPIIPHLIVDQYGAFLGKHQGRLRVSRDGEVLAEAPLLHLEQVLVLGTGVALSADAIRACCTAGIPIHFLDPAGRPYAALYSAGLTGTVLTRREQLLAYRDRRGVELAVAFARGKITNQANFLRYAAKYREEAAPEVGRLLKEEAERVQGSLDELRHLKGDSVEEVRGQILSIEGRAAQRYWDALKAVVPESYGWPGRVTRGAQDPVNAALNYGYGILYGQVERALVLAGLDPYGGFIHADRPGKPSLVFDLIEEFRTVVVDRTVVGMTTKGMKLEMDEAGRLTEEARRTIAEKILERLDAAERYEKKRQPLRVILQSQARHIATFVRGDRAAYEPFIARW
ncbi:MAG: CRISPR-associated endonuclease Cas1 [Anaerolineae bacterium]|jgi:CRISPR-associated protein Cas1